MITTELIPIKEQLDRIEKKLNGSFKNKLTFIIFSVPFNVKTKIFLV